MCFKMCKLSRMLQTFLVACTFYFCHCEGVRLKKYTPNEFLNHSVIKGEEYSKDSVMIIKQL